MLAQRTHCGFLLQWIFVFLFFRRWTIIRLVAACSTHQIIATAGNKHTHFTMSKNGSEQTRIWLKKISFAISSKKPTSNSNGFNHSLDKPIERTLEREKLKTTVKLKIVLLYPKLSTQKKEKKKKKRNEIR